MPHPLPRPRRAHARAILFAALTLLPSPSPAANFTWTGNGANFLFTASGNWSPVGQPGPSDLVFFATGFNSGTDIRIVSDQAVASVSVNTSTPFSISAPFGNTFSFGNLFINDPDNSASLTFNAPVSLGPFSSVGIDRGASLTFNNAITHPGSLPPTLIVQSPTDTPDAGSLTLNAPNSLRGILLLEDAATLYVRHPQALGTARLDLVNRATAHFHASASLTGVNLLASTLVAHQSHLTLTGPLTVAQSSSTFTPTIDLSDGGTITIAGGLISSTTAAPSGTLFSGGTANLDSVGDYPGSITLAAGNTAKLLAASTAPNASFILRDNSTLVLPTLPTDTSFNRPISLGAGGGTLSIPAGSTFSPALGQITHNNQTLTKSGPGTLRLTDAANLNAPILVSDGTLRLPTGLATAGTPLTVNTPGKVEAQGFISRPFTGTGTITATADAILGNPVGNFSFAGTITTGNHLVTLLSFAPITISGGITLGHLSRLQSSQPITLPAGSALAKPSGDATIFPPITLAGSLIAPNNSLAGTLTFASDLISTGSLTGNLRLQRNFSSAGSMNTGTLTLEPTAVTNLSGSSQSFSTLNNGSLTVSAGTHSHTQFTGTGTLTLTGGTFTTVTFTQSSATLAAGTLKHMDLGPNSTTILSRLSTLTIHPGAKYDLARNTLLLNYTGPANNPSTQIRQYLANKDLFSSTATTNPASLLTLAYIDSSLLTAAQRTTLSVDDSTLLIQLALQGDANLDGSITPDDYTLLDRSFALSRTNALWSEGDFNYDGIINHQDYLLIDTAHIKAHGLESVGSLLAHRQSQFGDQYLSELLTSIPEPTLPLSSILYPLSSLLLRNRRPRTRLAPPTPHTR